jgi:hypothetical protein
MQAMLRDANVEVQAVYTDKGQAALITVNDKFQHQFHHKSRVSQQLDLVTPKVLGERLTGGDYFFIGESLIDFRDRDYGGFAHDDAAIQNLMDIIGYKELSTRNQQSIHRMSNRTQSGTIALAKQWSEEDIAVPMLITGGDFWSRLNFTWNPFTKNVHSVFELFRNACENSMVNSTPFINMQIPLINRWEEHLEIANAQIQNKIQNTMAARLTEMIKARASVADLMILQRHIMGRLGASDSLGLNVGGEMSQDNTGLHRMYKIADPYEHLGQYYTAEALENKAMAAQLPSHLSMYDIWNMATEVSTHYNPGGGSSDAGLQNLGNDAMKGMDKIGNSIKESPFSNPEQAFFGELAI